MGKPSSFAQKEIALLLSWYSRLVQNFCFPVIVRMRQMAVNDMLWVFLFSPEEGVCLEIYV